MDARLRITAAAGDAGITLIETLIAMFVLLIGAVGMAGAFLYGIDRTTSAPNEIIATQKAAEAIESVFAARDSLAVEWDELKNASDDGIFLDGPQDMHLAGPDAILNTTDDLEQEIESYTLPGPDGDLGETEDNEVVELTGFTREIAISELSAVLREVTVVITYRAGTTTRTYTLTALISAYA
jgi:type II secretory pathway pseudopilin PulG